MHKTRFAGLTELDPGDPLTVDGSSFSERNPSRTDYYLRIGAVTHRHDAHAQLQNPSVAPSASIVPSGGQIAANVTIFAAITLIDADGGETMRGLASQVATPAAPPPPSGAITAAFDSTGGNLPVGQYQYAITLNDPSGGETILGPTAFVQRQPGFPSGQVNLSGLANEIGGIYTSWNLWRAQDGGPFLLVQANGSANSVTDTGFACTDASRTPPVDMTGVRSTNTLFVTLPTAAQDPAVGSATSINLYLSLDGTFSDPSLYATYPVASAGQTIAASAITLLGGAPPAVNLASQGANQINPDTDILDWHWKRPVANQTALPSGSRGDVRMTLDTGHLWGVVTTASAMGSAGWTDLLADPDTASRFEVAAAGGGGSASVQGFLQFAGASGATISVTDLGGGSAVVTIAAGAGGGGVGGGALTVAASGGASALAPTYLEVVGSGGVGVALSSAGAGSAQLLIGAPPPAIGRVGAGAIAIYTVGTSRYAYGVNVDGSLTLDQTSPNPGQSGAYALAVAPDGQTIYIATTAVNTNNLIVYRRNADNTFGAIQTLSLTGSVNDIKISADGQFVYAAATLLTVYRRQGDGTLVATGATYSTPLAGLAISPNGNFVFALDSTGTLTSFSRNSQSGALRSVGTVTGLSVSQTGQRFLVVSPDGLNLYIGTTGGLSQYAISNTGTLTSLGVVTATSTGGLAISPDGLDVYAVQWNTHNVAHYSRAPLSGILSGGTTVAITNFGVEPVVSPDGRYVYVSTVASQGIVTFSRATGGAITVMQQLAPTDGASWSALAIAPTLGALMPTDLEFTGSQGVSVTVGSGAARGGSAVVTITGTQQTVAGSAGASAVRPADYAEIAGSGGVAVAVQSLGGGSARVVIGPGDGGTATLASGTVTVNDPSVTATTRIMLTAQDNNTTGALRVSARTPGTSFTITSSNATDTGLVAYQFFGT